MLVLLIAMSSFAQMFVSLTFEPMEVDSLDGPQLGGQYQEFSLEGYLKAYTLMLGDFDSLLLRKHPSITVLLYPLHVRSDGSASQHSDCPRIRVLRNIDHHVKDNARQGSHFVCFRT